MPPIQPQISSPDKTDINRNGWIERFIPACARPYAYLMRLDRPAGTWLLLLPGWWAIALACHLAPNYSHAAFMAVLFSIGAVVMRGAGCVVNDIWDADFDAQVARTRTRPIASGVISRKQAGIFLSFLLIIGASILFQTGWVTIGLGILSLPFIAIYPVMKRITWWPQLFLGLTFNFGALMGWTAMTDAVGMPALYLYLAGIFWTLGYDTIYAHMDKNDDALIGVRSTARFLGTWSKPAITVFYALSTVLLALAIASATGQTMAGIILVIPILAGFMWQIKMLDINNPDTCLRLFKANREQGFIILAMMIVSMILF